VDVIDDTKRQLRVNPRQMDDDALELLAHRCLHELTCRYPGSEGEPLVIERRIMTDETLRRTRLFRWTCFVYDEDIDDPAALDARARIKLVSGSGS
jgi:hypothetical protein